MSTILITGGSGLIGTALTLALLREGHEVRHLSRSVDKTGGVPTFKWDLADRTVDPKALLGVDHIIHLAGAGIADKRWTPERVRELIASRADTAHVLLEHVKAGGVQPKSFVSAAGIGYYGATTTDHVHHESEPPGSDTIAHISVEWEKAVDEWTSHCRVVKLRTPVVLSADGGALGRMSKPFRWGLGATVGSGRQWMPWVHIDDLVRAYKHAMVTDGMRGAYNVVGGNATNAEVTQAVAKAMERPVLLPNIPGFALRWALGEMAVLLLEGSRASNARLTTSGLELTRTELTAAVQGSLDRRRS